MLRHLPIKKYRHLELAGQKVSLYLNQMALELPKSFIT
ncbi:hypothetical protein AM1_B0007 (plasmid) [Acaryochloris marina MBIC11017]|uniref:Uncharacterized protein n=1 Tax=Acaryochloris marina (strain MBIC 11017) TaxID=329726 RepID=A8ZLW4_ACAM1|nr:hypothetical protein AM1_B0007 [Acaryochloris marina MBIC11017]